MKVPGYAAGYLSSFWSFLMIEDGLAKRVNNDKASSYETVTDYALLLVMVFLSIGAVIRRYSDLLDG